MGTYYTTNNEKQRVGPVTLIGEPTNSEELNSDPVDDSDFFVNQSSSGSGNITISEDISESVSNKASRSLASSRFDGFRSYVQTNRLTYLIVDGSYIIEDLIISVETSEIFSSITEQELNQKVYIKDVDNLYTWDGSAWYEILSN